MSERHTVDNDAACPHPNVERREKFGGTPYWVCLDCETDWWVEPTRVTPPGVGQDDKSGPATHEG